MDKLLAAATAEFSASGYAGATTAAIARRGEVTEAQLFRYFPTKADLFREAIFKPMSEHIARFAIGSAGEDAADDAVRDRAATYIGELRRFMHDHARMLTPLIVAGIYDADARPPLGQTSLDLYFERGAATLAEGMGRGSEVAPDLMVRISFAAVLACELLDGWLFPEAGDRRAEIDRAIEAFVINGITPRGNGTQG